MFAQLQLDLSGDEINYRHSSNLQGVLMEQIAPDYAETLHHPGLNPYSQCLLGTEGKRVWCIRTVTEEAYEKLLVPMSKLEAFTLKNGDRKVTVTEKRTKLVPEAALMEEFYHVPGERLLEVEFQTPTAFKQAGRYVFYPDLALIYQSLMNKYSAASAHSQMSDEETLEQLVSNSEIVRYRLQSQPFPLEGVHITGFRGEIRIRLKGPDLLARYVRLLLKFGEYSGVGIKTGIGMGAIRMNGGRKSG